jgi:hypothetical protein
MSPPLPFDHFSIAPWLTEHYATKPANLELPYLIDLLGSIFRA